MPYSPVSPSRTSSGREMRARDPDDYDNDIPLQHKKPFGAGLKRKRSVAFVRASDPELNTTTSATTQAPAPSNNSIADLYLDLVMKGKESSARDAKDTEQPRQEKLEAPQEQAAPTPICPTCNIPLDDTLDAVRKHETSIPHQVALAHSHPPSSIDRSRMGLSYLSSFGWDPDARRGLGAEGQGIRDPIKVRPKDDTLGLGVVIPQEFVDKAKEPKPQKLSIKELRKRDAEEKRRGERLHELFYRSDDVLKHLGREV